MNRGVAILGTGVCHGGRLVTADEIDKMSGRASGWTARHTGVVSRHFIAEGETAASMGAAAVRRALQSAGLEIGDIDGVICGSGTMQQPIPSTAALILKALGPEAAGLCGFDINCTCLSFVVALDTASCLIGAGRHRRLVVVSSEVASVGLNWDEPESSGLMADGAAAAVIGPADANGSAIHCSHLKTFAEGSGLAEIRGGGSRMPATHFNGSNQADFQFAMDGPGVFRQAMEQLPGFHEELFSRGGFGWDDVDLVIPHQASAPALRIMRRRLGIPKDRFFVNVEHTGNTIAAAIPIAMHEAIEAGVMRRGMKVMLMGTSAGFSMGALLMTY